MHRGWIGFGSNQNGRKYVENRWQNLWQSGNNDGDSVWNKKQTLDDNWDVSDKRKWSWGNGGSHGWGIWGTGIGKHDTSRRCCYGIDSGNDWSGPENGYIFWGNTNMDSWKSSGGGEGWRKWEG
ncbi:hypothetical protein LOAG_13252 [Loa loa]|uniref:Carbohydrate-binding protein n=1 Tax=Loa loa TaxID=7209 RepID=A0A1I7VQ37_LOALO|nr:hypothetical protein LOAG_13252 [Loa loa]EFO15258.2 hypothetical protein LOAG_13252 [Loa loa]